MSELESCLKESLGELITPKNWSLGYEVIIKRALARSKDLAQWMLKTAIMSDSVSLASSLIAPETGHALFEKHLPASTIVDLAHIEQAQVGAILSPTLNRAGQWRQGMVHKKRGEAYRFIVQLNHLAMRLVVAPKTDASYVSRHRSLCLRVFPEHGDPEGINFSFRNLNDFVDQVEHQEGC